MDNPISRVGSDFTNSDQAVPECQAQSLNNNFGSRSVAEHPGTRTQLVSNTNRYHPYHNIQETTYAKRKSIQNLSDHYVDFKGTNSYFFHALLAIETSDHDSLEKYCIDGIDVNSANKCGNTLLMLAVIYKKPECVSVLLNHAANPNLHNDQGDAALTLAVTNDDYNMVELLCKHKADLDITDDNKNTGLILATLQNKPLICNLLLEYGANANLKNIDGETALLIAISHGFDYLTDTLCQQEILDIHTHNNKGDNALILAARNSNNKYLSLLLQKGADPDVKDKYGNTPLMLVLENQEDSDDEDDEGSYPNEYCIETLCDKKADINAQNHQGYTALMLSIVHKNDEYSETLCEYDADPNIKNNANETAIMLTVKRSYGSYLIPILAKHGAKLDVTNDDGDTLLMLAIKHNHEDALRELIKLGANLNIKNKIGETALMLAMNKYNTVYKEILTANSAMIN